MNIVCSQLQLASQDLQNKGSNSALDRLNSAIQLHPNRASLFISRGTTNIIISNFENAANDFDQAIQLDHTSFLVYYNMFVFKYTQKYYLEALKYLYCTLSALYLRKGLIMGNIEDLNLAIEYCSNNTEAYACKVVVLLMKNQLSQALKDINQMINNNPKLLQLYKIRAQIYKQLNEEQLLLKDMEKIKYLYREKKQSFKDFQKYNYKANNTIFENCNIEQQLKNKIIELNKIHQSMFNQHKKIYPNISNVLFMNNYKQHEMSLDNILRHYLLSKKNIKKSVSHQIIKNQTEIKNKQSTQQLPMVNQEEVFALDTKYTQIKYTDSLIQTNTLNKLQSQSQIKQENKLSVKEIQLYPLLQDTVKVQVTIIMAQIFTNKEMFGKMDPYCLINYNQNKFTTGVCVDGGTQPLWNYKFELILGQTPLQMRIEIYDKQNYFKSDDFIGASSFNLVKTGFIKLECYEKQLLAGNLYIQIKFSSQNG